MDELHIDIGAKDGDEAARARAHRRRRGDRRASPSSCPTTARSRARWTTAWGASSPTRRRGWCRGRRRARRRRRRRRRAGGDDASAARRRRPTRCAPTWRIVVDVTHATDAPGIDGQRARRAPVRLGPGHRARLEPQPARRRAALRHRRGRGDPVHGPGLRPPHRHRRRRDAHLARRGPDAAASACRCATCTRRSRWCSSTTSNAAKLIAASAQRLTAETSFVR